MRIWMLLKALAANGHEVDLLSFGQQAQLETYSAEIRRVCRSAHVVPYAPASLSSGADYWCRLATLPSMMPYSVVRYRCRAMKASIHIRLQAHQIDAVLCDSPYSLVNIPVALAEPLIVNSENIEHILLLRYLAIERNPARRAYAWLESQKLRRWEQYACARAGSVMVCSEHDRSVMAKLSPGTPITMVPNVVDTDQYIPTLDGDDSTVLYTGGMDWYPNRDAVEFFVSRILPELRSLIPTAKFIVAGRNPSEEFRRRFAGVPQVEFTGTVLDIRAEIAKAAVCVVPLRIGSGTRLKILEAGAMAKPIVSTRVGAEGLNFIDGEDIMLADEPAAFAHAVAGLLVNTSYRQRLGQAARRRVEEQYSFLVLQTGVYEAIAEAMKAVGN